MEWFNWFQTSSSLSAHKSILPTHRTQTHKHNGHKTPTISVFLWHTSLYSSILSYLSIRTVSSAARSTFVQSCKRTGVLVIYTIQYTFHTILGCMYTIVYANTDGSHDFIYDRQQQQLWRWSVKRQNESATVASASHSSIHPICCWGIWTSNWYRIECAHIRTI